MITESSQWQRFNIRELLKEKENAAAFAEFFMLCGGFAISARLAIWWLVSDDGMCRIAICLVFTRAIIISLRFVFKDGTRSRSFLLGRRLVYFQIVRREIEERHRRTVEDSLRFRSDFRAKHDS